LIRDVSTTNGKDEAMTNYSCGIPVGTILYVGDTITSGWKLAVGELTVHGLYITSGGKNRVVFANVSTQSCTLKSTGIVFNGAPPAVPTGLTGVTALIALDNGTVYFVEQNSVLIGPY
jgi:hypothetical protein